MSHTPISRDSMRIRRAQKLEEQRNAQINRTVSVIYQRAVETADGTDNSRYLYALPELQHGRLIPGRKGLHYNDDFTPLPEFHRTNMAEILGGVQSLFPDCLVEHTTLTMATTGDGKTYDISKIDEKLKPFIMNPGRSLEYIVVDWS